MMEDDLRTLVLGNAGVAALLADPAGMNAAPLLEGAPVPAITYFVVSLADSYLTLDGASGLEADRVQIDAWAMSSLEAVQLGRAIAALLHGYQGIVGATDFQLIKLADKFDAFEADTLKHRRMIEFVVTYKDAA